MHELLCAEPEIAERIIAVLSDRLHSVAQQMRAVDADLAQLDWASDLPQTSVIAPEGGRAIERVVQ
jgi:hypothetical protein